MKLCIDCKHNDRELWCKSPANGISVVDGGPRVTFASVSRSNSVLGNCGLGGINFEEKPHEPIHSFATVFKANPKVGFMSKAYQFFGKQK